MALLLPQFACLLFVAYDDMRELRHELQFHAPRAEDCMAFPFYAPAFITELLGIVAVVGLCRLFWWSRWLYAALAVVLFVTSSQNFLHPSGDLSILLVPGSVVVTLVLCFMLRFQTFHSLSLNTAIQPAAADG